LPSTNNIHVVWRKILDIHVQCLCILKTNVNVLTKLYVLFAKSTTKTDGFCHGKDLYFDKKCCKTEYCKIQKVHLSTPLVHKLGGNEHLGPWPQECPWPQEHKFNTFNSLKWSN
jgi:hypothetical protein